MKQLSGRPKKCSVCKESFVPERTLQKTCGVKCALEHASKLKSRKAADDAKEERKRHREAVERVKTRSQHAKDAQTAFNAWIRARDEALPCISCGRHHDGKYDAGHYRSVGSSPELRFEPLNVHKQCVPCNQHKSGNAIEYRLGLIRRIGEEAVNWLEGPHEPKRYTIEQLKQITAEYRAKLRAIRRQ